jgi:hypothetical protein
MGFQITVRLLRVYIKQPDVPSSVQVMVSFLVNVTDNLYERTLKINKQNKLWCMASRCAIYTHSMEQSPS